MSDRDEHEGHNEKNKNEGNNPKEGNDPNDSYEYGSTTSEDGHRAPKKGQLLNYLIDENLDSKKKQKKRKHRSRNSNHTERRRSRSYYVVILLVFQRLRRYLAQSHWPRFWVDVSFRFVFAVSLGVLVVNVTFMATLANLVLTFFRHENDNQPIKRFRERGIEFLRESVNDMGDWIITGHNLPSFDVLASAPESNNDSN